MDGGGGGGAAGARVDPRSGGMGGNGRRWGVGRQWGRGWQGAGRQWGVGEELIQANQTHKKLIYPQKCHLFINQHKGTGGMFYSFYRET